MAAGVQQAWSTTASSNDTADSNINWAENQAPSTINNSARAMMAALKKTLNDTSGVLVTGGTSTAYTLSTNEGFTALADGLTVTARMSATNGANATLAVDGLTARAIQTAAGTAAVAGTLLSGAVYRFTYYSSGSAWLVSTPATIGMTGDSGSGGTTGYAPAPGAGDAAAGKFLKADATYAVPPGIAAWGSGIINGTIVAGVAASALTVNIKTLAGADPSLSDPVYLMVRSATAANGDYSVLTLTSALSLTISSGSTMGATSNVAFRLWLVGFNDAGTARLGLVNLWDSSGLSLMSLDETAVASSTAEGGGGAADSSQVIYTGTAVTSKPYRILGYLEWTTGLSAAGTWNAAPTSIQLLSAGIKRPGETLQVTYSRTTSMSTGTTAVPFDDTIPQNTEGDQYMSKAITPRKAANVLVVDVQIGMISNDANTNCATSLFQDSTASALATVANFLVAAQHKSQRLSHALLANTTSSTTFKVRCGGNAGGTMTFNGRAAARLYGGAAYSEIRITEIMG